MKTACTLLFIVCLSLFSSLVTADCPSNSDYSTASSLALTNSGVFSADNTDCTAVDSFPPSTLTFEGNFLWWKLPSATYAFVLEVDTCNSDFDTVIYVFKEYTISGETSSTFAFVDSNDDVPDCGTQSYLSTSFIEDEIVYIAIGGLDVVDFGFIDARYSISRNLTSDAKLDVIIDQNEDLALRLTDGSFDSMNDNILTAITDVNENYDLLNTQITDLGTSVSSDIDDAVSSISGSINTAVSNIKDNVTGTVEVGFTSQLTSITGLISTSEGHLNTSIETGTTTITTLINSVAASKTLQDILDAVNSAIGTINTNTNASVGALATSQANNFASISTAISSLAATHDLQDIIDAISASSDSVATQIDSVVTSVNTHTDSAVGTLSTPINSISSTLGTVNSNVNDVKSTTSAIQTQLNTVSGNVDTILSSSQTQSNVNIEDEFRFWLFTPTSPPKMMYTPAEFGGKLDAVKDFVVAAYNTQQSRALTNNPSATSASACVANDLFCVFWFNTGKVNYNSAMSDYVTYTTKATKKNSWNAFQALKKAYDAIFLVYPYP